MIDMKCFHCGAIVRYLKIQPIDGRHWFMKLVHLAGGEARCDRIRKLRHDESKQMADIRVYDRTLTAAEVLRIYAARGVDGIVDEDPGHAAGKE